jgi:hypothetical protein
VFLTLISEVVGEFVRTVVAGADVVHVSQILHRPSTEFDIVLSFQYIDPANL